MSEIVTVTPASSAMAPPSPSVGHGRVARECGTAQSSASSGSRSHPPGRRAETGARPNARLPVNEESLIESEALESDGSKGMIWALIAPPWPPGRFKPPPA